MRRNRAGDMLMVNRQYIRSVFIFGYIVGMAVASVITLIIT